MTKLTVIYNERAGAEKTIIYWQRHYAGANNLFALQPEPALLQFRQKKLTAENAKGAEKIG